MTATALAIAVDLPERELANVLAGLTRAGLVTCSSDASELGPDTPAIHTWRARYRLADLAAGLPRQRRHVA